MTSQFTLKRMEMQMPTLDASIHTHRNLFSKSTNPTTHLLYLHINVS